MSEHAIDPSISRKRRNLVVEVSFPLGTTMYIELLHFLCQTYRICQYTFTYHKVENSRLSRLVVHLRIFRLVIEGKFDAHVL